MYKHYSSCKQFSEEFVYDYNLENTISYVHTYVASKNSKSIPSLELTGTYNYLSNRHSALVPTSQSSRQVSG